MSRKAKTIFVADHFCGAGGTSTGVAQACKSDQTKQIGNAVPPIMGEVLSAPILAELVPHHHKAEAIEMEDAETERVA